MYLKSRSGLSTTAGVAIVVVLLIVAAGAYYFLAYNTGSSTSTTSTTSTTTGPLPGKGMSIGVVFDVGGLGDRGFNDLAYQGMMQANTTLGMDYKYEVATSTTDIPSLFQTLIGDHLNIIVGVGFDDDQAINQSATANPNQLFAQVDGDEYNFTNVIAIKFTENVGSAIVGALAAAQAGNGAKIGFLGGVSVGIIYKFWNGYKYGVEWADQYLSKTTGTTYTNTLDEVYDSSGFNGFADSTGGYTNGQAMISRGDKVIFTAAGGTGIGTFNAIGQYDEQQGWNWSNSTAPPVWAIGVDANQDYYGTKQFFTNANSSSTSSLTLKPPSFILTSEIKAVNTGVFDVAKWTVNGNFSGIWQNPTKFGASYYNGDTKLCGSSGSDPCYVRGVLLLGYQQDAVGPTSFQYTSQFLNNNAKLVLSQIEEGILNGTVKVPEIYTDTGTSSLLQ
ncbi:MAG TPA: BMP family ABC transporter substrate-binding protein [Nitrososphaerales archaeon]|nr:BMP family ABC transporter substrate-binding protein [Nitrososphaerales archaeon]